MYFTMTRPCHDCPFLRVGGIRLGTKRIAEIAGGMLEEGAGLTFACHKTVWWDGPNEPWAPSGAEQHCAGALLFAFQNGIETQAMQIATRLGLYDPTALTTNTAAIASVFDSLDAMLDTAI